jgi:uncharacterized protein RhaS with RHS repeats
LYRPNANAFTAAYSYDALDRRMARSGSGVNVTPQRFLSAGDEEIAELGPTGSTITRRFVPGVGADQPVATVAANGAVSYYHADRLGSIVALSSGSGALADRYKYSPSVWRPPPREKASPSATPRGGSIRVRPGCD